MTEPGPQSSEPGGTNRPTPPPPPPPPPPQAYPNQPSYGTPPVYGTPPAYSGSPGTGRPGQITAAAVIAFVMAALQLLAAIGYISLAGLLNSYAAGIYYSFLSPAVLYILALLSVAFGALLIWGGLLVMQGKTNKILFFTAIAAIVVSVISNIAVHSYGYAVGSFILPGVILFLLWQQPNKDWFVAQGGQTI
jgi:hypothetical protein